MADTISGHISLIKSPSSVGNKPVAPAPSQLIDGEIAVNYGNRVETLFIKNSVGQISPFSADHVYTKNKLGDKFTDSNSSKTVSDVIDEEHDFLQAEIEDLDARKVDSTEFTGTVITVNHKLVTGGTGLSGGDRLSADTIVINHDTQGAVVHVISGSPTSVLFPGGKIKIPTVSYDSLGHVVSGSTTELTLDEGANPITGITDTDEIKLVIANKILKAIHSGHTNGGTASSSTVGDITISNEGSDIHIPYVVYNKYGHIINTGETRFNLFVNKATTLEKGIVQLTSSTGTSETMAMTQKGVTEYCDNCDIIAGDY